AYSQTEEIIEICKVVREYNGLFVVHQRSEADTILSSMDEIIRIGRESGVQIHFSHFKVCGKQNWDKLPAMLHKLDHAKAEGIEVSLDQYPYIAGSTMLGVILPPWVHDGGTDQLVLRLQSKELRQKMKQDIQEGIPGWDNFVQFAGTEGIFVTSVLSDKNQNIVGLSLDEIGKKWGVEPLDAAFDLLLDEKNAVGMVDFYGTEDHVISILKRPETNVCTDGLLSGKPHPRVYGSFPRVLGKYARENALFPMEEAVYKMTGKAAKAFHIRERGILKEGYFADITIFNPNTVIDKGTFSNPEQYPEGIAYVIVNGQIEIALGEFTGDRAGRVIRR
ncbi:MAG: amidohydrolase family protein, partial [Clostridiales bacterium]|nr:amidohydrolase family protein [Clostridiales bacterium]